MFLKYLHECLTGEHDFYEDVFASLGVPYEAVEWRRDNNPVDDVEGQVRKQMQVDTVINMHRVRGHLIADLDPLRWKEPKMHPELDPATYGLTIWDLDREFLTGGLAGPRPAAARRDPAHPARRLLPHDRRRVHAHPGARAEAVDPGAGRGRERRPRQRRAAPHPRPPQRGRGLRAVPRHQVRRGQALRHRGGRVGHPDARRRAGGGGRRRPRRRRDGHVAPRPPQRALQHRRQEPQPDLQRVRGRRRARTWSRARAT